MMLAGLPVAADAVAELATLVRDVGADELADRLDRALSDEVKLLALTLDERALLLAALEDPPQELPSCARSCSPTTSGGAPKGSTELRRVGSGGCARGVGRTSWVQSGPKRPRTVPLAYAVQLPETA
jgi:hypothetical protein